VISALLVCLAATPEVSPEVQLAAQSLRAGERARLEKALGPLDTLPLYTLDLEVFPDKLLVTGREVLHWVVKRAPLEELFFRLPPNAAHPGAVVLSQAKVDGRPAPLLQPDPSLFKVVFEPPVPVGQQVTVEFKLLAHVPPSDPDSEHLNGSMEQLQERGGDYGAFSCAADACSLAGVVPMVAPELANGELMAGASGIGDLGTFDPSNAIVSVVVPSGWRAVMNGAAVGEVPEAKGGVRFTNAVAGARELPLFALKGAEPVQVTRGELTVEATFLPARKAHAKEAADDALAALEVLEARLGPSPYRVLRVVESRLSNGAGGMEFPGLISVSTALVNASGDPSAALGGLDSSSPLVMAVLQLQLGPMLKQTLEFTIDHEVAHQYFAMLVGNDPIEHPVVDEPLTQHVALLIMEWRHGKAAAEELRTAQLKGNYQMYRMLGGNDRPANRPTSDYRSNGEYAAMIYGKAPLLFDAQRALVGEERWVQALKAYVDEYRYRWATPKSFVQTLSRLEPGQAKKLEALRRHWWEEKHGDEDIGALDIDSLMKGISGNTTAPAGLDPRVMKEFEKAMKALSGGE
jgi:hypothetical protein